jgi:hypothetical protein
VKSFQTAFQKPQKLGRFEFNKNIFATRNDLAFVVFSGGAIIEVYVDRRRFFSGHGCFRSQPGKRGGEAPLNRQGVEGPPAKRRDSKNHLKTQERKKKEFPPIRFTMRNFLYY